MLMINVLPAGWEWIWAFIPILPMVFAQVEEVAVEVAAEEAAGTAGAEAGGGGFGGAGSFAGQFVGQAGNLIKSLFGGGGGEKSHAQRADAEAARDLGRASGIIGEIQAARSWDDLFETLVSWESGYVGGTHGIAIGTNVGPLSQMELKAIEHEGGVSVPGNIPLMEWLRQTGRFTFPRYAGIGHPNPNYAVLNATGFRLTLTRRPTVGPVAIQSGAGLERLAGGNASIRAAIQKKANELRAQDEGGVRLRSSSPLFGLFPGSHGQPAGARLTSFWPGDTQAMTATTSVWAGVAPYLIGGVLVLLALFAFTWIVRK